MKTAMRNKMKSVKTKRILLPILLSTFALGACSQNQNDSGVAVSGKSTESQNGTVEKGGASGVTSSSTKGDYLPNSNVSDGSDLTLAGLKDPNHLLSQRVIYFDYNQSSIRPEYMVLINTHAKLAAKFPQLNMRLEGHADERGSREYNVALSEQRASSVRRIMGTQGARSEQIRIVGYGEELPVVQGHNQKSWQKNRRVEIKYDNY